MKEYVTMEVLDERGLVQDGNKGMCGRWITPKSLALSFSIRVQDTTVISSNELYRIGSNLDHR